MHVLGFAFSSANTYVVWQQIGEDIYGDAPYNNSGASLAISTDGMIVAVGSLLSSFNGEYSGHVSVYEWDGEDWKRMGDRIDGEARDYSGSSVALSADGKVLAIGSSLSNRNGISSGHVIVYQWSDGDWQRMGERIDGEAGDSSGSSVSLAADGLTLAVGSPGFGALPFAPTGKAIVYKWVENRWIKIGNTIFGDAPGQDLGRSVSLSSDGLNLAVGATPISVVSNLAGCVRVFQLKEESWQQIGEDILGNIGGDQFGYMIALSGDGSVVGIGAPYDGGLGSGSGYFRAFRWTGDTWHSLGSTIYGEADQDRFGNKVTISSSGEFVAIGAYGNDENAVDSGNVRVFRWLDSDWQQVGLDIYGEAVADGCDTVSISGDGKILAVGAARNDVNGIDSGHVRVFRYTELAPVLGQMSYYDCNSTSSTLVDATPVDGFPAVYSYKWSFRPIGGTFFALPASFNGPTMEIACDPSSEGTWRVEVTNEAGTTAEEFEFRLFADADGDMVADYVEINIHRTDPNDPDTDGDGLDDGEEMDTYGTDPLMVDSNSDGYPDGFVVAAGFDPTSDFSVLRQSTLSQLQAQRPDSVMATVTNGTASIEIQIEESDDLINWTDRETIELVVPLKENETTEAFRVTIGK
jgi:hypothetical protein